MKQFLFIYLSPSSKSSGLIRLGQKIYALKHNYKIEEQTSRLRDHPTMIAKRVLPLALLHAAGGRIKGKTRFQKLAFLADQRLEKKDIDPYEFVPYDYGPFSKELLEEVEHLEKKGFVKIKKSRTFGGKKRYDYELTEEGSDLSDKNFPKLDEEMIGTPTSKDEKLYTLYYEAKDVVEEFNEYPISNLIDYVYEEYPSYASESVLN